MRHGPATRLVATACLAALLSGCATTRLAPISGPSFQLERDEKRLWEESRVEERKLRAKARIYQDPLLVDYLEEVVSRLNPPGTAASPLVRYRVTVIEDPTLNAFAYPTGSLYVHTGLLARMENEDQLATVLGHEMSHVDGRHMVRFRRSARNKQIGFGIAAIAGAVIVASEAGHAAAEGKYGKAARTHVLADLLVGLGLHLALVAAVNGYGRDLEREADEGGFRKMADAGYDVGEAPKVYQALLDNHGESGKIEAFFFGSHPQLRQRIETAKAWGATHGSAAAARAPGFRESFERRIRPVIRDDAKLNIEAGRLRLAEDQLRRVIAMEPADPEAHFLLGTLKMQQGEAEGASEARARLRAEASAAFNEAIRLDANRPGPHREAGLLAYRAGDLATACARFRHYLEIDPKAEDAPRVRDYVVELEGRGQCPR